MSGLGMSMSPQMSQQLRMTPELQQAIKLLQLSRMELIEAIQKEMVENPVLEEAGDTQAQHDHDTQTVQGGHEAQPESEPGERDRKAKEDAQRKEDAEWQNLVEQVTAPMPTNSYKGLGEEMPGVDQTLSTSTSLSDTLIEQLRMVNLCDSDSFVALWIIGSLDEHGYLRASLEEIALEADIDEEEVDRVLQIVQSFEPLGVAARDLSECLSIQLQREHPKQTLALTLVCDHIPDLQRKSYGRVARQLGVDKEAVLNAARLISTLEPKPGRGYETQQARYITPDIYIKYVNGEYVAMLNEDGLPKLRVSNYYKQELKRKRKDKEDDEVKEYIQGKLRGAVALIRSIHRRQDTIVQVTQSIIKFQRDFFEKGVEHLKPLVLRDIADDIEMHESTVSRVTTNKYVHTPRGLFELKYFFNSSITKDGGEDMASEAVKAKIRDIITQEPPSKPLSDSKIVKMLAEEDIIIARRTVAKYREMMGILSSSQRKQMF